MSSDLATLRAAGFDIISSSFVTELQELIAELQQRNADLLQQNANLTRTLNEELEHALTHPPAAERCSCCFSATGCRSSPLRQ